MAEHEDLPFRDEPGSAGGQSQPPPPPAAPHPPGGGHGGHSGDDRTDERGEQDKRRLFERVMPEILKRAVERAVETGASRLAEGPEGLRNFVQEMKLPKEVLHYLYQQIDDTKNGLYRVVAKEIRDVLEQTQFADEITKVLTKLSFEIKTEIRFIPNDAAVRKGDEDDGDDRGGRKLPKPEVKAQVSVKDRGKDPSGKTTTGAPPPNPGRRGREDT